MYLSTSTIILNMHEYEYEYEYSETNDYFRMYSSMSTITLECLMITLNVVMITFR